MTKLKRGRAAAALIAVLIIAAGATATQPPASAVSGTALSAIAGTVTDAAGHPLRHVLVNAESWVSIGSGPSAWTDAQGHYLVHSGPGDFTMTVRAGRATGGNSDATGYYEAARFQVIRVKAGRVRAGVDLRLRPAAAISGRVTDSYEYRLSGVLPYLRPALAYAGDDLGLADDDELSGTYRPSHRGRFRITGVAPGAYQLCFQAAYRRVTGGVADDTGYDGRCVPGAISVVSGTVTRSGTAALQVLRGGGVLAGTVRGFDAAALKGVTVTARQHRSEASAVTDRNGRYAIHALAARPTRVCFQLDSVTSANATGYAPQCLPGKVQVRARQVQHASVTLAPGAAIGGTVTGADGTALAGAPVEILHGMGGYEGPSVDSDDSGHYAVKNLAPGGQYDACTDTDFSTAAGRGDPTGGAPRCYQDTHDAVQLKPGVMTSGIDLKLEAAGGVRGRVVDKHGRPIRGVEIELEGPSQFGNEGEFYAVTDAHGRYSAVDLPPAKYEACFSNRYFYEQCYPHTNLRHAARITVPAGKFVNGIDAALDNTAPPSVRVTAVNRSGQPLAGVDAALFKGCPETNDACAKQPLLGGPARMVVSEDTGTNGHATLAPYRPGTYRLCLFAYYGAAPGHPTATGYADTCAAEPITIPKAGQAGTVKVVLARAGAVTGIVIDKAGHRLAGVRMHISGSAADDFGSPITHFFGDEMSPALEAYTDAHGRFLIRSVQPGRQRMRGRGHRVGRVLVRARRVTRHVRVVISRPPPSRDMGTAPDTAAPRRARPVPSQPRRVPAPWWRTVAS